MQAGIARPSACSSPWATRQRGGAGLGRNCRDLGRAGAPFSPCAMSAAHRHVGFRAVPVCHRPPISSFFRYGLPAREAPQHLSTESDLLLSRRGPLARLFKPLFIAASWQMYPLGLLFGLGFDTASEIGLLGISAAQATQAVSLWPLMVFPALFTAGMALVDTTDGILMLGAYGWAFVKPVRKLYYT